MSRLSLLPAIAAHAALGAVLLSLMWTAGFGLVRRLTRSTPVSGSTLALGYAVGLCVASFVAVVFLANRVAGVVALVLPAVGIVEVLRARSSLRPALAPAVGAALLAAPFVAVFSCLLGLYYHGPSAERGSSAFGDMLLYLAKLESAQDSVLPFRDLLVHGQHFTFTEGAPTFLGAAVAWLPGFDPFLFNAVTLPAMFGLAVAAGIGSLGRPQRVDRWVVVLAAIGAAAVIFPSWLVESPPVALAVPLAFGVFWLARSPFTVSAFVVFAGAIALALALTKFMGLVFLGAVMVARIAERNVRWDLPRSRSFIAVGGAFVAACAAVAVLAADSGGFFSLLTRLRFLPLHYVRNASEQVHTGLHIPWGVLTLAGTLLVLIALVRSRERVLAVAFAVALVESWVEAGIVDITGVVFGLIATVCVYFLDPVEFRQQRLLLAAAAACLTLAALGQEYTGTYVGPALLVSLAAAFFAATRHGLRLYPASALLADLPLLAAYVAGMAIWLGGRHATFVLVVWPVLLLGLRALRSPRASVAAALAVVALSFAYVAARATLPPETGTITSIEHNFWNTVDDAVPKGALIFTSFTGETVTQQTGWNYYPSIARRQLYLAGWADSPMQGDAARLAKRLALNARVLHGTLPPNRVASAPSYYAVVDPAWKAPASFALVETIGPYFLYEIRQA